MVPLPQRTSGHVQRMPGIHEHPAPRILQSAEQPSPSAAFESSHTSPRFALTTPSPQRAARVHGEPGAGQPHPVSSAQAAEHPSLALVLPSSQVSPGSTRRLPQIDVRVHAIPGMAHE